MGLSLVRQPHFLLNKTPGMNKLKRFNILLTLTGGVILFLLLQFRYAFHLHFLEQHQLFLTGKEYARELLSRPGGFITYASQFIIQFFILDYAGSIFITILLLLTGITLRHLLRNEPGNCSPVFLFESFILFFLLLNILDTAFHLKGITGYLLCLLALLMYDRLQNQIWQKRILYGMLLVLSLFWLAAPFQTLFLVTASCTELRKQGFNKGRSLLWIVVALCSGYLTWRLLGNGTYRIYIALDGVCSLRIIPGWTKYAPWLLLPVSVLLTPLLYTYSGKLKKHYLPTVIQILILIPSFIYLLPRFDDNWSLPFKRLNHYATQERWDDILTYCQTHPIEDYSCVNYQNLALAKQGILADSLLAYPQMGGDGLFTPFDRTVYTAFILQEINYHYGSIASAQRYAFEGNVSSETMAFPQTIKMLIRTNILQEEYKVAAKYIHYLRQTLFYRKWAGKQYRYISGTGSPEEDPEYTRKQKYLRGANYLLSQNDLLTLAKQDTSNEELRDFALCYHLLNKDLEKFLSRMNSYAGEIKDKVLPLVYYEALMACVPNNPEVLQRYAIPEQVKNDFEKYASIYSGTTNEKERKEWLSLYYTNSYWFYFHYK